MTGGKSNSTLSGNISLDQGDNEFVSYQQDEYGNPYVAFKIDAQGVHFYNKNGVELSRFAPDGTYYYNASGNVITKISTTGFEYFDDNGVKRASFGISNTGMIRLMMYDADGTGRTLIGQNPKTGDQVSATTVAGQDVETEFLA